MASGAKQIGAGFVSKRPIQVRLLVLALIVAAGLFVYDHALRAYAAGYFPLVVHVEQSGNQPIKAIAFATLRSHENPDELQDGTLKYEGNLHPVTDFDGHGFRIDVSCDTGISGLGREFSYIQHNLLLLNFELADGHSVLKVVEIPDGRRSRRVSVAVP